MPKYNLPNLPDVNRTKNGLELMDALVKKHFEKHVGNLVESKRIVGNLPKKVPGNLIEKAIVIDGQELNALLIENKNILNVNNVQELINRTALPLLHPSVTNSAYEGLYRYRSIVTDWIPMSTHLGLSGLNVFSCYNHGVLCLRSLVIGNFVDACFHTSVAAWNGYRAVFQLIHITSPVDTQDVLLEGVSLVLTSSLLKVKSLFTKGRKFRDGIEAASVLIMLPFSKMENGLDEQSEITTETEPGFEDADSELEILLHVLMVDFD